MPTTKKANSLRSRIIGMQPRQTIVIPLGTVTSNTVYNYASFIGRDLERKYTTRYDKTARVILVTRES